MFRSSHRPDGEVAGMLAPTHACTNANALVNSTGGACKRDLENFPTPRWADGRLTFCSLLAGRWCRSLWRHSGHLIVHHQWEHSCRCACSYSKVQIASMGTLLTCLPGLSLAQLLPTLWSTSASMFCRGPHISNRPDGIITGFALVLSGRRCSHHLVER